MTDTLEGRILASELIRELLRGIKRVLNAFSDDNVVYLECALAYHETLLRLAQEVIDRCADCAPAHRSRLVEIRDRLQIPTTLEDFLGECLHATDELVAELLDEGDIASGEATESDQSCPDSEAGRALAWQYLSMSRTAREAFFTEVRLAEDEVACQDDETFRLMKSSGESLYSMVDLCLEQLRSGEEEEVRQFWRKISCREDNPTRAISRFAIKSWGNEKEKMKAEVERERAEKEAIAERLDDFIPKPKIEVNKTIMRLHAEGKSTPQIAAHLGYVKSENPEAFRLKCDAIRQQISRSKQPKKKANGLDSDPGRDGGTL